jgi:hypothetical protein
MIALAMFLQISGSVPLDGQWELQGPTTRVEDYRGIRAIRSRDGRAVRRDVVLQDGTIEFDVELIPYRTFVYVQFRVAGDGEFEEIYFRAHKSGLPDAVQYNPVWNGDSFWQLWHGPGATASPRFEHRTWMHVRIELEGRQAALFLGSAREPTLVMPLAREPRPGYLAFRAFNADPGLPPDETTASFANVRVTPGRAGYTFAARATPELPRGTIGRWQVSPAVVGDSAPVVTVPGNLLSGREAWPSFDVEPTGVLVIGRHLRRPRPIGRTIARLVLRAPQAGRQRLYLGYSDRVTVFVNGNAVFAGDASYSFDMPRQEGLIGTYQSTIWLPLNQGSNEILLVVTDGFGGWGLQGRLEPGDGAVVLPAGGVR